jgi:hypothetical protein
VISWLLMLLGRPGAMGAGMLAAARQAEHVRWCDVSDITAEPHRKTLVLCQARRPLMVVFCDGAQRDASLVRRRHERWLDKVAQQDYGRCAGLTACRPGRHECLRVTRCRHRLKGWPVSALAQGVRPCH